MDNSIWEFERKNLERVIGFIEKQLEVGRESVGKRRSEAILIQRSMWDYVNPTPGGDLDDLANIWQFQMDIDREGRKAINAANQVGKLERMLRAPYFGRIDFKEDGEISSDRIYIGISNLMDEKTHSNLVYDWRAPVSSMFYDYETGRAGYKCPVGFIEGEMTLKRQFRIWMGRIEFMFDSSLKIDDEILQEILSKSADSKMRTIVTSIQREQNKIIRNDTNKLLIVQGPAGSGKTSIALHRIAYLLYRYRELVLADNIVIFSPNRIFNDYISNVLPELGEENMHRTTFMEYAEKILGNGIRLEDMSRQMEYILSYREQHMYKYRIMGIKYKSSTEFVNILKGYITHIEDNICFEDIIYNDSVVETREEILEYFNGLKFLPLARRLDKIRSRLIGKIDLLIKERVEQVILELADTGEYLDKVEIRGRATFLVREEFSAIREKILRMSHVNSIESYAKLFRDRGLFANLAGGMLPQGFDEMSRYTLTGIGEGRIYFEDVAPLLFLNCMVNGVTGTSHIKHVIIDEAQDYTPVQFEVLKQLFGHCSITMLGDLNQSINPFMNIEKYEIANDIFKIDSSVLISLSKSYRSTRQISEFCRELLESENNIEYINREGIKPIVYRIKESKLSYKHLQEDIVSFRENGIKSMAVICRTVEDSRRAYDFLAHNINIRLVKAEDEEFFAEASIIPSYLAKGLEFDVVLVLCNKGDYENEEERKLFYTCCTRALHNLRIYCTEEIPSVIGKMDENLFDLSTIGF